MPVLNKTLRSRRGIESRQLSTWVKVLRVVGVGAGVGAAAVCALTLPPGVHKDFITAGQVLHLVGLAAGLCAAALLAAL